MGTSLALTRKLGALFKEFFGTAPAAVPAGTRFSAAIDRMTPGGDAFQGGTLVATAGAETGAPAARTLDAVQDSADGAAGWADYIPPGQSTVAAITPITTANTIRSVDVDLSGAKRFIRTAEAVAFTGGTAPTLGAHTALVLYGADRMPV